ncbi:hepatic triacylglycerol lipase-like isoform X4 [Melanaphis sacchari]|uniref:hepatic triacylglycerol lipase-like isoform X4 n=1 Tax=Melanaphis sacchari TaxID=742174 RepID=UPI000DC13F5E|nr:hepatic triacylglycerol lipase-like isoform X4 [Melanaphis sacchari]
MSIFLTILVLCMASIHSVLNLSVWDFLTNPNSTIEEDLTLIQTLNKDGLQFFYLNQELGHDRRIQMDLNNVSAIVNYWMKGLPLKVTVHGWHGSENAIYGVYEINDAYIGLGGFNIITVDWSSFASNSEYAYSAAVALTVGTGVAVFLENVVNLTKISPTDIHLIGYNLGAHVVGRCGYRFRLGKIGRITELQKCSQQRAYELYRDFLKYNSSFIGTFCDSYENYMFKHCEDQEKIPMGHYANLTIFGGGSYYLSTNDKSPFHGIN